MKLWLLALVLIPRLAGALAIDFGESFRAERPVILYFEGRTFRYEDREASQYLLLLFKLTHPAREASFLNPKQVAGVARQIVPGWSEYGARVRKLGSKLVRAKIIERELPPATPTNAELVAYLNAEGPRLSKRLFNINVTTFEGRTSALRQRLSARGQDPLSLLLSAYSWDWPVTHRMRDHLELRSFH